MGDGVLSLGAGGKAVSCHRSPKGGWILCLSFFGKDFGWTVYLRWQDGGMKNAKCDIKKSRRPKSDPEARGRTLVGSGQSTGRSTPIRQPCRA